MGEEPKPLIELSVSLKHVIILAVFLVTHTVTLVSYLQWNFTSQSARMDMMESTAIDEIRVREMLRDPGMYPWNAEKDSIKSMIGRNERKIDQIDERARNLEISVASRNNRIDKLIEVIGVKP